MAGADVDEDVDVEAVGTLIVAVVVEGVTESVVDVDVVGVGLE